MFRHTFRRAVPVVAALALTGAAQSAAASPAVDTDLFEIDDGLFNVNAELSYQSSRAFRGVQQAEDEVRLKLKTSLETGLVNVNAGVVAYHPIDGTVDGVDEPTEVNIYAVGSAQLLGFKAEAGATYYIYPGAEDTGLTSLDLESPDSLELHVGIDLPIILPVMIRAYYDLELENTTVETRSRYRLPLVGDRLELELNSVVGYVNLGDEEANANAVQSGARTFVQGNVNTDPLVPFVAPAFDAKDHRVYYGVGAAVASRLTSNIKVGANVNWEGTTGEYAFDGQVDDELLWGGITLTAGF